MKELGFLRLTRLDQVEPDREYNMSQIAGVVIPWNGRRLDEALRNDPIAPSPRGVRNARVITGREILAYVEKSKSREGVNDAMIAKAISDAERIRAKAQDHVAKVAWQIEGYVQEAVDKILSNIPDKNRISQFDMSAIPEVGVYFLYQDETLVYIGQSINVVSRIGEHRRTKKFNSVIVMECRRDQLSDLEGFFIQLYKPPLNGGKQSASRHAPFSALWQYLSEFKVEIRE